MYVLELDITNISFPSSSNLNYLNMVKNYKYYNQSLSSLNSNTVVKLNKNNLCMNCIKEYLNV